MNDRQFRTVPVLETQRLVLKEIWHNEVHSLYLLFTDERVVKTFGYRMEPTIIEAHDTIAHWRKLLDNNEGVRWGIYLKPSMKLIGNLGFKNVNGSIHVSIGYALSPYYWRQGIMTEALAAVIAHAFTAMSIQRIEATVFTSNTSSTGLLQKLGFTLAEHKESHYYFDGRFHDVYLYTIDNGL